MKTKYFSVTTETEGRLFNSKKEAKYYELLKAREDAGEIKNLKCQVYYELTPRSTSPYGKCVRESAYIADFTYEEDGKLHVIDVKGFKGGMAYTLFKLKKKLMWWRYGLWVEEV